jgi:hypothetical protein
MTETLIVGEMKESLKGKVKLHDCALVVKTHKDKNQSYYGGKYRGVVVEVGDEKFSIKTASGDLMDFGFDAEDKNYTYEILQLSEIDFLNEIEKQAQSQEIKIKDSVYALEELRKWKRDFEYKISLLGKLQRYFSR